MAPGDPGNLGGRMLTPGIMRSLFHNGLRRKLGWAEQTRPTQGESQTAKEPEKHPFIITRIVNGFE